MAKSNYSKVRFVLEVSIDSRAVSSSYLRNEIKAAIKRGLATVPNVLEDTVCEISSEILTSFTHEVSK